MSSVLRLLAAVVGGVVAGSVLGVWYERRCQSHRPAEHPWGSVSVTSSTWAKQREVCDV